MLVMYFRQVHMLGIPARVPIHACMGDWRRESLPTLWQYDHHNLHAESCRVTDLPIYRHFLVLVGRSASRLFAQSQTQAAM